MFSILYVCYIHKYAHPTYQSCIKTMQRVARTAINLCAFETTGMPSDRVISQSDNMFTPSPGRLCLAQINHPHIEQRCAPVTCQQFSSTPAANRALLPVPTAPPTSSVVWVRASLLCCDDVLLDLRVRVGAAHSTVSRRTAHLSHTLSRGHAHTHQITLKETRARRATRGEADDGRGELGRDERVRES